MDNIQRKRDEPDSSTDGVHLHPVLSELAVTSGVVVVGVVVGGVVDFT